MTQAPLKGKLVCLTYFRGCWIICALLQGRYNSSLAINYLTMGCHQSACNFHCQVHSIFVYPWTHIFSSWQEEVFLYRISNELCVSSEIHYFTTYYSEISFATDQKKTEKNCNIFLLKNCFFYEGLLQRADWKKCLLFCHFLKYVSANSHKSVRYCNPVWYYILGKWTQ